MKPPFVKRPRQRPVCERERPEITEAVKIPVNRRALFFQTLARLPRKLIYLPPKMKRPFPVWQKLEHGIIEGNIGREAEALTDEDNFPGRSGGNQRRTGRGHAARGREF
jgi:hypothetical protein